jgi:hypothetical protein
VMQSRVDTRLAEAAGPFFPPLHPSFLETAKLGHDDGSETRPSNCFPPPKQQSQDATARGGPPASTYTPSIHARRHSNRNSQSP